MKRIVIVIIGIMILVKTIAVSAGEQVTEPCELVIETVIFGEENPGIALVEEAVNKITVPAIGVKVKLLNVGIAWHAQMIGQMISGREQIDLVTAGLTFPMTSMAADNLLLPLNDLLTEYGADLPDIFGEQLNAGYVGENLYAIPAYVNCARASGFMYNHSMADAAGVNVPNPCTMEELEEIFGKIRENLPEVYGLSFISREVSIVNFLYSIDTYGSSLYTFGVTFDPWNNTEIVNLYDSEQFRQFCETMRRWQLNGYLPPNMMNSSVLPQTRMEEGQVFGQVTGYSPFSNTEQLPIPDCKVAQMTEAFVSTGLIQERMWAIPISSAYPEKAMQFLNLLYTNSEVANLLTNGVEGIHYERVSDHVIQHTDNPPYIRVFSVFGDAKQTDQWVPATEKTIEEQIAFEATAKTSLTLGYSFDSRNVANEIEAVNAVIESYTPALECGMIDDIDAALELFNQELRKAGIDRIIAENRQQLEEWMQLQKHN